MMKYTSPSGDVYELYLEALKAPHLMIAGATGSGKSVLENALIYTALFRHPGVQPGGVQIILVDPKRVELVKYKDLPHTLRYASEPCEMVSALQAALRITDDRYRAMQRRTAREWDDGDIYVFIDEFADLVLMQKKAVLPLIQRLGQIGRAAHVHVILCTQCPLIAVIPTAIKVNFDVRFALRTANRQHSFNIMDSAGCECLPDPKVAHRAQGYYVCGANRTLYNLPMIPESEIDERVTWWTQQKKRGFFGRLFGK